MGQHLKTPAPTPGGPAVAVVLCLFPLAFLVVVTLVRRVMLPTYVSLPAAAALMAVIRLAYLSSPPALVAACVVSGLLEALTPLTIIAGAIALFQSMQHTGCLAWIMETIKDLSDGHPVAEVYLIGFSFAYLVEGASGFGTPVALAAPMLASLGHDRVLTVSALLVFNTLATVFGAVGTPVWFGFSGVGLNQANLQLVGFKASVLLAVNAFIIGPIAAGFMVPWRDLARSGAFVALATASAVAPAVLISLASYEFPSLAGGLISVAVTGLLIRFKVGLRPVLGKREPQPDPEAGAAAGGGGGSAADAAARGGDVAKRTPSVVRRLMLRAPSSARSAMTQEDLEEQETDISPRLGSVPAFPIPMSVPINLTDRGVQVDAAGFESALALASVGEEARGGGGGEGGKAGGAAAARPPQGGAAGSPRSSKARPAAASPKAAAAAAPTKAPSSRAPSFAPAAAPPGTAAGADTPFSRWLLSALSHTLPLTGTVVLLMLTRIPALRIKGALQAAEPRFLWQLGTLGDFGISASLVVQLLDVLRAGISWRYELLYVPFVLPFLAMSLATIALHRRKMRVAWWAPFREAYSRVKGIMVATFGALVLVQLIRHGGADSPAYLIGYYLSGAMAQGFLAISALLGAVGSFFSGSTTVSNLTFAEIQEIAAERLGMPVTSFLAVQAAGASSGNAFTISNILAAKAVMGMQAVPEAVFLRRTLPVGILACLLAQVVGLIFTLGGMLPDVPEAAASR